MDLRTMSVMFSHETPRMDQSHSNGNSRSMQRSITDLRKGPAKTIIRSRIGEGA